MLASENRGSVAVAWPKICEAAYWPSAGPVPLCPEERAERPSVPSVPVKQNSADLDAKNKHRAAKSILRDLQRTEWRPEPHVLQQLYANVTNKIAHPPGQDVEDQSQEFRNTLVSRFRGQY